MSDTSDIPFRPWVQEAPRVRSSSTGGTSVSSCPASPLSRCPSTCSSSGDELYFPAPSMILPSIYQTPLPPPPAFHESSLRFMQQTLFMQKAIEVQNQELAKKVTKRRPKNHGCHVCPAAFSNKQQLVAHIRSHTGEKPFECNHEGCSKRFARNEELTRHKKIHENLKPFKCNQCTKKFNRRDHLSKHIKTHIKHEQNRNMFCADIFNPLWYPAPQILSPASLW